MVVMSYFRRFELQLKGNETELQKGYNGSGFNLRRRIKKMKSKIYIMFLLLVSFQANALLTSLPTAIKV